MPIRVRRGGGEDGGKEPPRDEFGGEIGMEIPPPLPWLRMLQVASLGDFRDVSDTMLMIKMLKHTVFC